ncbi:hypothetical protein H8356DRAFT_1661016 [Neocallimastix lanati (nom. inval.)]|uniref:Uncharacterized protein n=1 Tax=Neocallimastix californiae TaxID=1754190 RepID=A0A1Y2DWI6_9FUNG|nr:hypothetical protein H8356DRAFT_1661016 [Neocallimastix sp. JGI-2020a]ORY63617.1 hypothetical protein LY90DRAFT_700961 [Neocallimastix californiae]|eukprot:ORY63617.1 hypothetical protein LY90DRAFT_700961 [Neocallimastix californiae]
MKFYTLYVTLLFITTTVFSYSIVNKNRNLKWKRDVTVNVNQYAFSELAEGCSKDLENFREYYDCTGLANINRTNFQSVCTTFNSEKCQTVLKDPLSYIPNCKKSAVIDEMFSDTAVNMRKAEMNIICHTDEQGKLCPVAEIFIDNNRNTTEMKNAIRRSCLSEKCNEVMIDTIPELLAGTKKAESLTITEGEVDKNIDEEVDSWIDFLKSKECTHQYNQSEAIPLEKSFVLMLTLTIILSFSFLF